MAEMPGAIQIEHDTEAFVTTIRIRAEQGRVAWADVLRGLARARGYDDSALEGVLPGGKFKVTGVRASLIRAGLNRALRPHVHFSAELAPQEGGEPGLVISVDRAALLASQRRFTKQLREAMRVKRSDGNAVRYGLVLDERSDHAAPGRRLVVYVHGLNSAPQSGEALLATVQKAGFPCGSFRYPNDQPIADSAKLLADELAALAKRDPDRRVSLVTHSMGGLVARAAIEDPQLDPGNVRQLIMIAPPNHGSALARFSFGLDVSEHLRRHGSRQQTRQQTRRMYALIEDGLSEAAVDLNPSSQFLKKLNDRGRNAAVQYTIFLGDRAPLSGAELALLRKRVAKTGQRSRWVGFFGPRVDRWLDDLDEVVDGKGDGAVAVQRGRLQGVDDVVVLDFSHTGVLRKATDDEVKKLYREVIERLRQR